MDNPGYIGTRVVHLYLSHVIETNIAETPVD